MLQMLVGSDGLHQQSEGGLRYRVKSEIQVSQSRRFNNLNNKFYQERLSNRISMRQLILLVFLYNSQRVNHSQFVAVMRLSLVKG